MCINHISHVRFKQPGPSGKHENAALMGNCNRGKGTDGWSGAMQTIGMVPISARAQLTSEMQLC